MRISIDISLEKSELPKDYRRGFMSLLKAGFSHGDEWFFRQMYEEKTDKPFTFSVFFPELKKSKNNNLNVGDKAILNFSTYDPVTLTHLYNGLRKVKKHVWQSYNTFSIERVRAVFNKKINKDRCQFRTISPFLVNQKGSNLEYLCPEDTSFDNGFRHSIEAICKQFLNYPEVNFGYEILHSKKMIVSHYNQSMTCNKGIIDMKAKPEVLDLLYNVGIGLRRSQGFGMVELI